MEPLRQWLQLASTGDPFALDDNMCLRGSFRRGGFFGWALFLGRPRTNEFDVFVGTCQVKHDGRGR